MPKYVLDRGSNPRVWDTLDTFTQGYIEAAMWTMTRSWFECADCEDRPEQWEDGVCAKCGGEVHEHTDDCDGLNVDDIAPETIAKAREDCRAFQEANRDALERATEEQDRDSAHHGHDFG